MFYGRLLKEIGNLFLNAIFIYDSGCWTKDDAEYYFITNMSSKFITSKAGIELQEISRDFFSINLSVFPFTLIM